MREPAKQVLEKGGVPEDRSIINISSTSGTRGNAGQLNYAAGKGAVISMSKTISKGSWLFFFCLICLRWFQRQVSEWGQFNIRCNAIAFGRIATRLTADKKDGAVMTTPAGDKVALGIPGAANGEKRKGGRRKPIMDELFVSQPISMRFRSVGRALLRKQELRLSCWHRLWQLTSPGKFWKSPEESEPFFFYRTIL
jgi:NAD(P)-dependent dehydrogenase (short-subunit alcohol dehydrogenase family)